jgi:quercetin dioxygenase-like cupin family protein
MKTTLAFAVAVTLAAVTVGAQAPGIKRTVLQKGDVNAEYEVVLARAEISPGGSTGRHTHPGTESGYVLEGSTQLEVEGQPTKVYKAGDSYFIPAGTIHNASPVGDKQATVLATYVVKKGEPLATPAK